MKNKDKGSPPKHKIIQFKNDNKVIRRFFNGPLHGRDIEVCKYTVELRFSFYKYILCRSKNIMFYKHDGDINI